MSSENTMTPLSACPAVRGASNMQGAVSIRARIAPFWVVQ